MIASRYIYGVNLPRRITHSLKIAIADRELQVPAHRPQDYLGREAEAAEYSGGVGHERYPRKNAGREHRFYPGTLPRSMQQIPISHSIDLRKRLHDSLRVETTVP